MTSKLRAVHIVRTCADVSTATRTCPWRETTVLAGRRETLWSTACVYTSARRNDVVGPTITDTRDTGERSAITWL